MSHVRIVSKRAGGVRAQPGELVVPIDRSNPVLGNPFVLKDHNNRLERAAVLRQFEELRARDEELRGPLTQELERLAVHLKQGQSLALLCWCAPRPCHGHLLRRQLERMTGKNLRPADESPVEPFEDDTPPAQGSLF